MRVVDPSLGLHIEEAEDDWDLPVEMASAPVDSLRKRDYPCLAGWMHDECPLAGLHDEGSECEWGLPLGMASAPAGSSQRRDFPRLTRWVRDEGLVLGLCFVSQPR
jgi:hypothetical protein